MVFSWQKGLFRSIVEQQEVSPFISSPTILQGHILASDGSGMPFPLAFFLPLQVYSLWALIAQSRQESVSTQFMHQGFYDIYRTRTSNVPHMTDEMCLLYSKSQGDFFKNSSLEKKSVLGGGRKCLVTRQMKCVFLSNLSLLDWSKPFHPPFDFLARCFLKLPP